MQLAATIESAKLPENLNELLSTHELLCRSYDAVESISWPESAGSPAKVILTLLTYSYSTGVYGSAEIESALSHDPALRYITKGFRPAADEIRLFRRRYSRLIEGALTNLFLTVSPRHSRVAWEARHRVQLAVRTDSLWLDI